MAMVASITAGSLAGSAGGNRGLAVRGTRLRRVSQTRTIDDWHRTLVERIKRHFDKKRKQWENTIDNKVATINSELHQEDDSLPSPQIGQRISVGEITRDSQPDTQDIITDNHMTLSDTPNGDLCVISRTKEVNDDGSVTWTIDVDIQDYVREGTVLVSPGSQCVHLSATKDDNESPSPRLAHRKSHIKPKPVERTISLKGSVETDKLRVTTSRAGVLTIQSVVKPRHYSLKQSTINSVRDN